MQNRFDTSRSHRVQPLAATDSHQNTVLKHKLPTASSDFWRVQPCDQVSLHFTYTWLPASPTRHHATTEELQQPFTVLVELCPQGHPERSENGRGFWQGVKNITAYAILGTLAVHTLQ